MKFSFSFILFFSIIIQIFTFHIDTFGQTTYYISSSQGNDSNNGTSSSSAWQTLTKLQSVLPSAVPGDRFLFKSDDIWTERAGVKTTYSGTVGLDLKDVHGISNNYITIGSYGNGANPTFNFTSTGAEIQLEGCRYTNIQNLNLTTTSSPGNRPLWGIHCVGSINGGAHHIVISNCTINNLWEGARFQDAVHNIIIENCNITNNFGISPESANYTMGIFMFADSMTVRNCYFNNNGRSVANDPGGHDHDLYCQWSNYLIIENNKFHHSGWSSMAITGNHIVIRGNDVSGCYWDLMNTGGYEDRGCTDVLIENNYFHDGRRGIFLAQVSGTQLNTNDKYIIKNNTFENMYLSTAITVEGTILKNSIIANNTIVNCYEACITFGKASFSNDVVKNNIFYNDKYNTCSLLLINSSTCLSGIDLDYNLYYKNTGIDVKIENIPKTLAQFKSVYTSEAQHSFFGDPLFVDPVNNDFGLKTGSPAIQSGVNLGLKDISGNLISGNPDIGAIQSGTNINQASGLKIFLQGSYQNGVMTTNLDEQKIIPLFQPYAEAPWNYSGEETVSIVPQNIVDWVLVELRKTPNVSSRVIRQAAFINSNGKILNLAGSSNLSFSNVADGDYYIVIIQRNHLAVMSAAPVSLTNGSISYDFTTDEDKAYGSNPMADLGNGVFGMYGGDSDSNGIIDDSDVNDVGNNLFSIKYLLPDVDLNSKVSVIDYKLPKKNLGKKTYVTGIFIL